MNMYSNGQNELVMYHLYKKAGTNEEYERFLTEQWQNYWVLAGKLLDRGEDADALFAMCLEYINDIDHSLLTKYADCSYADINWEGSSGSTRCAVDFRWDYENERLELDKMTFYAASR